MKSLVAPAIFGICAGVIAAVSGHTTIPMVVVYGIIVAFGVLLAVLRLLHINNRQFAHATITFIACFSVGTFVTANYLLPHAVH